MGLRGVGLIAMIGSGLLSATPTTADAISFVEVIKALGPLGMMSLFCYYLIRQSVKQEKEVHVAWSELKESSRIHHENRDKDMELTRTLTEKALKSIDNHTAQSQVMSGLLIEVRDANRATHDSIVQFSAQSAVQATSCQQVVAAALNSMKRS